MEGKEEADRVGGESRGDIETRRRKITAFLFLMNRAGREKKMKYFKSATVQSRGW